MPSLMLESASARKELGSFYTPKHVAQSLVKWAVRSPDDSLLDPSCGDGRFLQEHKRATGVDCDVAAVAAVARHVRHATVIGADFFEWAALTPLRFDCAAGNPPFIRYQRFAGTTRSAALELCSRLGVKFSSLTSSWAPFVAVAASLLKPGGRMAFVVPAEIGHSPYAIPLVEYLLKRFADVRVIAVRDKVFPDLSEDVWFVYADGYGGHTDRISFTRWDSFQITSTPPVCDLNISRKDWERSNKRLRPFVLPRPVLAAYLKWAECPDVVRFGEAAKVGIGYVTGDNDFFHLRPSQARALGIPDDYLVASVRRASYLPDDDVTISTVAKWLREDQPVLLLRLLPSGKILDSIEAYLNTKDGRRARATYKCRNRSPWYTVPDVRVPDGFLAYMSGGAPKLVANSAGCVCTNSIHAVRVKHGYAMNELKRRWAHPLVNLSCELEGHPLGGGMLKLEPTEAARVILPSAGLRLSRSEKAAVEEGVLRLRRWRHYA